MAFFLHLLMVVGLFVGLQQIESFNNSDDFKLSLTITICVTWFVGLITIYTVRKLTKNQIGRWMIFLGFTILTAFILYKILGSSQNSLINLVILLEPLCLCTLIGLLNVKLRSKKDHFNSLCAAVIYILLSACVVYLGCHILKDEEEWVEKYKNNMLLAHVGIVFGCVIFLITLNEGAKYNSRFSKMNKGEFLSCAFGIYLEILISVSLSLCIIFA
jgi:hypothetical protein